MGKFWGDYTDGLGKTGVLLVCWSTQAAISRKRVEIEEKSYHGGPIGNQQCSFERYHPRPPTASSSPRLGFATTTQNSNRYYLSYELQIWQVHSQGPSEQKPIKNFAKKGTWAYPGTAQILGVLQLSQEQVKLRTSNLAVTFSGSIRTKAH